MNTIDRAEKFMAGILANADNSYDDYPNMAKDAFNAAEAFEAEAKKRGLDPIAHPTGGLTAQQWAAASTGSGGTENRQNPGKPPAVQAADEPLEALIQVLYGPGHSKPPEPTEGPLSPAVYFLKRSAALLEKSVHNAAPYAIAMINEAMELLDPDGHE